MSTWRSSDDLLLLSSSQKAIHSRTLRWGILLPSQSWIWEFCWRGEDARPYSYLCTEMNSQLIHRPSRQTRFPCLSAMNAKGAFIYSAWTEISYQLWLSLSSRDRGQKNLFFFQKLNISCYVNGNKTLKSWHSRIRCSDYNIVKCNSENPGLHLVIRPSVNLCHISHFSLFSFLKISMLCNFLV
jgi:hypothetical protein